MIKKPPFKLALSGISTYKQLQQIIATNQSLKSLYWEGGEQTYIMHFRNQGSLEKKVRELNRAGIYVHRFTYHADEMRACLAEHERKLKERQKA